MAEHHHFGLHHHEKEHHHEAEHHHRRHDSPSDLSESDPGQHNKHSPTAETFPHTTADFDHAKSEEKKHKKEQHHAELGALAAGALAMHEHHKAKSEGEDSGRHKLEGKIAGGLGVGAVGYALHEHHEKKKEKKEMEELEKHGHEKHGWFS
ncbi:hypothetical protein MPTK1_4g01990 [Marchantia polymorpha subsp. ruderalis]|uniref:Uncharacterized protein n=2 Tax=Marchantia polymorpha TaxID=3197 RepID=A0A176VRZ1_MARPO|nr:hypothetical protein AXG93_4316s1640 [Marchantia polymorpha subsp. ruderalis]PTQ26631.1 hypothetical protein MARPO_0798s0001 [Marchantia polymorpha]BBN07215.1 hypothetical protein Mp_4g01990 [Marchantia polymorpha subsp. ruderalis]|eukprot:PTQ26631.1 hypothetical protein MARPO_0798s0001 [Marchantia polymorpha]